MHLTSKYGHLYFIPLFVVGFLLPGCKKYLDAKPDIKLAIPSTVPELQSLLDNTTFMNTLYSPVPLLAGDEFYMEDNVYNNNMQVYERNVYTWASNATYNPGWNNAYQAILNTNIVLGHIDKVSGSTSEKNYVKGSALFFRALNFYQLAQIYCLAYHPATASSTLGIPVRLVSDIDAPSSRTSLEATYQQIVSDYKEAIVLMNDQQPTIYRPTKSAAYAALARIYLTMGDYEKAKDAADSYLSARSALMNLNSFLPGQTIPRDNVESVFLAIAYAPYAFHPSTARADDNLIALYEQDDLRLRYFFNKNDDDTYSFMGSYEGSSPTQIMYAGLSTNEVYLIRAECYARLQNVEEAMNDINKLLENRYAAPFIPLTAGTSSDALNIILNERRKELVFRGMRWMDVKRLNTEQQFAITLQKTVNGTTYTLPPNDSRYALLLPEDVIRLGGMQQNPR